MLSDSPGRTASQKIIHTFDFCSLLDSLNLFLHSCVVGWSLDRSYNSKSYRIFRISHISKHILDSGIRFISIMNEDIFFRDSVFSEINSLESPATLKYQALVIIFTKNHRLTLFKYQSPVVSNLFLGNNVVDSVIEYNTILKYFNN